MDKTEQRASEPTREDYKAKYEYHKKKWREYGDLAHHHMQTMKKCLAALNSDPCRGCEHDERD